MRQIVPSRNLAVEQLRKEILAMQGFKKACDEDAVDLGLGPIEAAFPGQTFPLGAIHEFTSQALSQVAATNGFISNIVGKLMNKGGACVWVSTKRTLFPAALKVLGVLPERIIFVDPKQPKHALWAIEEALKCSSLAAVIGELGALTFTESRRLQLAVEHSHVTGFIHRIGAKDENALACVSRWRISALPSLNDGMPGVGFPRLNVQLVKVRNGSPGQWIVGWNGFSFEQITHESVIATLIQQRKAG